MKCRICLSDGPFTKIHTTRCMFNNDLLCRYECPNCNVIFGTEAMIKMSPEKLGQQYVQLYSGGYSESDATDRELKLMQYLQPVPEKTYLNWGAGNKSSTVPTLAKQKITLASYDPYAVKVQKGFISKASDLGIYDGIMSCNFIEHLQDPINGLQNMLKHLAPGGIMVHGTPCYQYRCINTRFHLYFFLGKSVEIMAERAGLIAERTNRLNTVLYYRKEKE